MYTLDIDTQYNTIKSIMRDGVPYLYIAETVSDIERNMVAIVNTLNTTEHNFNRSYVSKGGDYYYELLDGAVIKNGIVINKTFNQLLEHR